MVLSLRNVSLPQFCACMGLHRQREVENLEMRAVADPGPSTAERYRDFAEVEAPGQSVLYEQWALGVAGDRRIIELIDELPLAKRQVNLVFGAIRAAGASVMPYDELREWLLVQWPAVRHIALTRSTQTNEAARCAVLLPLLGSLPQPLALLNP